MRRNRGYGVASVLAPLLACILSGASPARAADGEEVAAPFNPIEVGVFGGVHFYNKDHGLSRDVGDSTGTSPDTGGAFGFRLSYNPNKWIGVEGEGLISPTRTRNDSTRDIILGYRAHLIATFIHTGYVRPFVVAGYGALSAFPGKFNADDGQRLPRGRDTDGMIHVGVGAKFPITDMFGLRFDARGMAPGAIASSIMKVGTETHYGGPDFELLLTGYMGFGGEKPAPAPALPPPSPAPAPVVDKDTDGDGIPDSIDKCPNEPETVNGYQDDDGCPDELPAALKKFTGVIEGIHFKTKSAEITKDSFSVLDKAVAMLLEYTDVRLEIGGHTDNVGKAEFNMELSQKRAESVKTYLVGKGVQADRLTSVGYGMDKPLTANKTAADKAKNRRTEFTLLTGK